MQFDIEVHWNPDGLLEGEICPSGVTVATPFWGITELIGLLQAQLGPARPAGDGPPRAAWASKGESGDR